jgi:hypothetical protein
MQGDTAELFFLEYEFDNGHVYYTPYQQWFLHCGHETVSWNADAVTNITIPVIYPLRLEELPTDIDSAYLDNEYFYSVDKNIIID